MDTKAAVQVDDEVGRPFTVKGAVLQGCVIGPAFINVFRPYSLKGPLSPTLWQAVWRSNCAKPGGALSTDLISCIVASMHADDLTLLAELPGLLVLLGMVVAGASKTCFSEMQQIRRS
eukprot:229336-Chlamydomonas_euryale.AAC.1